MAGLDPAIYGLEASVGGAEEGVDARLKAGHDELSGSVGGKLSWKTL